MSEVRSDPPATPPTAPATVLPAVPRFTFFAAAPTALPPIAPAISWMMRLMIVPDIVPSCLPGPRLRKRRGRFVLRRQPSRAIDRSQSPFPRNAPLAKVRRPPFDRPPAGRVWRRRRAILLEFIASNPDPRISACETPMRFLASPRPRPPTRSARPTESWPRSFTPTSTRATSAPRSSSRRSPPPTICFPIRTSGGGSTPARSTPRGRRRRRQTLDIIATMRARAAILTRDTALTGTSPRATTCSPSSCAAPPSRRGADRARTCITSSRSNSSTP